VTTVSELPYAEKLVGQVVREALDVKVHSSIPAVPVYPLVIIKRFGGVPAVRARLDSPELQFDCYADTKTEAFRLASSVRKAVHEAEGTYVEQGEDHCWITSVADSGGPQHVPDGANPPKDRYILSLRVDVHQ